MLPYLLAFITFRQHGLTFVGQEYTGIARCRPAQIGRLRRLGSVLTRHGVSYQIVLTHPAKAPKVNEYELWVCVSDTTRAGATVHHNAPEIAKWLSPHVWPIPPKKKQP